MTESAGNAPRFGSDIRLTSFDACCLAMGCIIGSGAFSMPASTFLPQAGPAGTTIALALAALGIVVIAINYHFMANDMPEEGGAYAYALHMFGPRMGFACAWFLVLAYLSLVPYNASALALLERDFVGGLFEVGPHYAIAGYDVYALEVVVQVIVVVVAVLLIARGTKLARGLQAVMGTLLVACVLALTTAGTMGLGQGAADPASVPLFNPDVPAVAGVFSVFAVAPWAFVGFDTIPQSMGSMGFTPRRVGALMVGCIIISAWMYVGLNALTASVVPQGYESWVDYVADVPNLEGLMAQPTFYAAYTLFGRPGYIAMEISLLCALLMGIIGFSFVASRLLCLMGAMGSLPAWFGKLSETGSPVNALRLVAAVSLVAMLFGRTAMSWVVDVSSVGAAIAFMFTSAAAFKRARDGAKRGRMLLGAAGVLLSLLFVVLLLVPVPGFGSPLGPESYVALITWIALGINFYNPVEVR